MKYIMLAFCIALLLNSSCDKAESTIDQVLLDSTIDRLDKEITNEEDRFRLAIEAYHDIFSDGAKIKYWFLVAGLDTIISARNWNRHRYDVIRIALEAAQAVPHEDLLGYQNEFLAVDSVIFNQIVEMIQSNFDRLGFHKDAAERHISRKRTAYERIKEKSLIEVVDELNLRLKHKLIYLSNSERLKFLENFLMELTGGKSSNCFGNLYFPVVLSDSNVTGSGSNRSIRVGVGQYSTLIYPPDAKMIVENDTIPMSEDGVFLYQFRNKPPGEYSMPLEIILRNPRTENWDESVQGEYAYSVK